MDDTIKEKKALKTQYQPSLTELINLYGSLSRKAFKGEIIAHTNPGSSLNHVKSS